MKGRCYSYNRPDYHRYGGRGITVCPEWRKDFVPFYTWSMENGWKENLELDRRNNDGNYEPLNCCWVTHVINSANRGLCHYLNDGSETLTLTDMAKKYGLTRVQLSDRLTKSKWPVFPALLIPTYSRSLARMVIKSFKEEMSIEECKALVMECQALLDGK